MAMRIYDVNKIKSPRISNNEGKTNKSIEILKLHSPHHISQEDKNQGEFYGLGIRQVENGYQFMEYAKKNVLKGWSNTRSLNDPMMQKKYRQRLEDFLLPSLQTCTSYTLRFISKRLIDFGKPREIIKKKHFLDGVWSKEDKRICITKGCGLKSKVSVDKGINDLLRLNFIRIDGKNVYSINLNAINEYLIEKGEGVMSIRVPSKDKSGNVTECEKGTSRVPLQCKKGTRDVPPYNQENNLLTKRNISSPSAHDQTDTILNGIDDIENYQCSNIGSPPPIPPNPPAPGVSLKKQTTAERIGTQVVQSALAKQEAYKAKQSAKPLVINTPVIKRYWDEQLDALGCIRTNWTVKDFGTVKNFINSVTLPEGRTILEFFDFAIHNWDVVIDNHLRFSNQYRIEKNIPIMDIPAYPDIKFLMQRKESFKRAFTRSLASNLTDMDRLTRKLKSQGFNEALIDRTLQAELDNTAKNEMQRVDYEKKIKQLEWDKKELARKAHELKEQRRFHSADLEALRRAKLVEQPITSNVCIIDARTEPKPELVKTELPVVNEFDRLPKELHKCAKEICASNTFWPEEHIVNMILLFGIDFAKDEFMRKEA